MTENIESTSQHPTSQAETPPVPQKVYAQSVRQILFGGLAFIAFLTVLVVVINSIGVEDLQQIIQQAGPLAPLVYIAIKTATYIFAPLTSGPIQVVAGTLFDSVLLGVLYTLIGEVIGGSISFWLARRFGRPVVLRFVGDKGMQQVETFYRNQMGGWQSLAAARIVLFSFWDFLSYAAGLAKSVRYSTYFGVSVILGFFPTFFFVWLGNSALVDGTSLILIYGLVALFILLPIMFRKPLARLMQGSSATTDSEE